MLLFTAAAGAVQTVYSMNWLPEYITWTQAAGFGSLRIDIEGDGQLVNLDTAGLNNLRTLNMPSDQATVYTLQLSDGFIANKTVTFTVLNVGGAPAINIYGRSKHNKGLTYVQYMTQACQANTGKNFAKFSYLGLPAIGATDYLSVNYADGLVQRLDPLEAQWDNALYQNDTAAAVVGINNVAKRIASVDFQPVLLQNVYIVRLQPVGAISATIQ